MTSSDPEPHAATLRGLWVAFGLLCALTALLYRGTLETAFFFDDVGSIAENDHIEALTPLARALDAPPGSGASGRPLTALTLALNFAVGGRDVFGYRLFNLLLHLTCALLSVAVLTLGFESAGASRPRARMWALVAAGIWVVHPLHTAAINHVVYRNEMLASAFMLGALYAALRALPPSASSVWQVLATICGLLAAASKEIAVALPVSVLIFDCVLARSAPWSQVRKRPLLYAGLLLVVPVTLGLASWGDRGVSVGSGVREITRLDYLRTQAGVLGHYAQSVFWPAGLVLDYDDWPVARSFGSTVIAGLAVATTIVAAIRWAFRGSMLAATVLAAFCVLAPTSSVIPLTGAIVGDHRMYLASFALLLVAGAACARALPERVILGVALCVALALGFVTYERNQDFSSPVALWEHNVAERPANARAWNNLGHTRFQAGDLEGARAAYREALAARPDYFLARANLGYLHLSQQDFAGARDHYRVALELDPLSTEVRAYLGSALVELGELREGTWQLDEALRLGLSGRQRGLALLQLAWTLATAGDDEVRDGARAQELLASAALPRAQKNPRALDVRAAAAAEVGDFETALELARKAQRLAEQSDPNFAAVVAGRSERYKRGQPWREPPVVVPDGRDEP